MRPAIVTVCLCLALSGLQGEALAQPVIFSIGTSTGNDTLTEKVTGSITFDIDANGADIGALQIFARFEFTTGNLIGPISEGTNFFFSPASTVMELPAFNNTYGNGTDPDSIFFGAADLFAPGWMGSGEFARVTFTPPHPGKIYIDSAKSSSPVYAADHSGIPYPVVWTPDTIHVMSVCTPNGDVNCDGSITSADIIYLVGYVFKGGPPPCE